MLIYYGQINSRSISSILVVNSGWEFTRLDPRFSRVDVELTRVNQICIRYHVTDQPRMSSWLNQRENGSIEQAHKYDIGTV